MASVGLSVAYKKRFYVLSIISLITLCFYLVPFLYPLSYPFLLISTLVHEMGHGVGAILVGGHFVSFKMWTDGSGVASIAGDFGRFSRAFVAASGLVGPAIVSAIFFACAKSFKRSRIMLGICAIVLAFSLLLVVRNFFGVFFVSILCGLCFYFSLGKGSRYAQFALCFLALELCLSVFSRADYLFTDKAITQNGIMPSDVSQIAENLFLPYWFWGTLCALFSLLVLIIGLKSMFKD